jgi:hypothetical protein
MTYFYNESNIKMNDFAERNANEILNLVKRGFLYPAALAENSNAIDLSESNKFLERVVRQVDLDTAADSSYGSGHSSKGSGYGGKSEYYCPEGIPVETALFALLGAAGLSFGVLFMAITMITGGRRRKRGASPLDNDENDSPPLYSVMFNELIWEGMSLFSHSKFTLCF